MKKFLLASTLLIVTEIVVELFFRYPCNHGNDFHVHAYILILFLLLSLTSTKNIVVAIISSIALMLIMLINYYNIGINYDTWIERCMPEWGEIEK